MVSAGGTTKNRLICRLPVFVWILSLVAGVLVRTAGVQGIKPVKGFLILNQGRTF